eukprot:scaffold3025_cov132-Isochrysis_galbana.AAC.8
MRIRHRRVVVVVRQQLGQHKGRLLDDEKVVAREELEQRVKGVKLALRLVQGRVELPGDGGHGQEDLIHQRQDVLYHLVLVDAEEERPKERDELDAPRLILKHLWRELFGLHKGAGGGGEARLGEGGGRAWTPPPAKVAQISTPCHNVRIDASEPTLWPHGSLSHDPCGHEGHTMRKRSREIRGCLAHAAASSAPPVRAAAPQRDVPPSTPPPPQPPPPAVRRTAAPAHLES